jgi:hypothetical protein
MKTDEVTGKCLTASENHSAPLVPVDNTMAIRIESGGTREEDARAGRPSVADLLFSVESMNAICDAR